jgi:DMSO/TMAO reductase YedYZ molybdopterin-dependent catalytic subunit
LDQALVCSGAGRIDPLAALVCWGQAAIFGLPYIPPIPQFSEAVPIGPRYYNTQSRDNVLKAECLLAHEMNAAPLGEEYGAPLRLRVENQLGYKMVKWIERIEFIESEKQIGKGEGGTNEDDEYFDLLPNI